MTMVLVAAAMLWGGCALLVVGTAALSRVPPVEALLFEPARQRPSRRPGAGDR